MSDDDLKRDPRELRNIYEDPAQKRQIAKLKKELTRLKKELQDKYLEITAKNLERGRYERMMTAAK